jgi:hypothetical protein
LRRHRCLAAALASAALAVATGQAENAATEVFAEVAARVGLDFQHFIGATGAYFVPEIFGSGVALFDFDNDGDLDVFLVQGTMLDKTKSLADSLFPIPRAHFPGNRLFRNELAPAGELRFTDVTERAGVAGNGGYGMGVAVGDYDNDGFADLFVSNYGQDMLFHNNGDGTFTDVTARALPLEPSFSASAAFVDYDRDGFLDLFVTRYNSFTVQANKKCAGAGGGRDYCGPGDYNPIPDKLYRNDGRGRFFDVTQPAGISAAYGNGLGVVCADFDGDGWIDIFVANDKTANQLWMNRGDGTFEDRALESGAAYDLNGVAHAGMGVTAADFDGDGDEDIFISNILGETHMLYQNDGKGLFEDVTSRWGLGHSTVPYTGFGTLWFDYDNDGRLDLFIANGEVRAIAALRGRPFPFEQRNQLFHHDGGRFRDVTGEAGAALALSEVSRGAAFGDIDNDGDIDIVVANANGPVRLLLNRIGTRRRSIEVRLRVGARDALGARAALLRKGRPALWRRVATDGSYLSASDPRLHFGLGSDEELRLAPPEALLVVWPDGSRETRPITATDRLLELRQGGAEPPPVSNQKKLD